MIRFIFALLVASALIGPAAAQTYPSRPIKIVVPFPPGGSTDLLARRIGDKMSHSTGQPVIVENRPGAGGTVGSEMVAGAPPDGYTLLMGVTGSHGISVSLNPKLPYHPLKDFEPISTVVTTPLVLVVSPQIPATDLKSFVAFANTK